jgi:hypothetical protein
MKKKPEINLKLKPDEYRKILTGISLEHIALKSIKADKNVLSLDGDYSINHKSSFNGFSVENNIIVIPNKHSITFYPTNNPRKKDIKIDCTYEVLIKSDLEFTKEFFDIYCEISFPIIIWPYIRELVQSITSRMGIPPLTIPMIRR